jgi:hypothetical protein
VSLEPFQGHPGVDGHLRLDRIDRIEPGQPGQAQDHLAARRYPAGHHAGVAALGHDRRTGRGARADHGRNLRGVRRPHHAPGGTGETARPVGLVRRP